MEIYGHQKQRQYLQQLKKHNRMPQAIIFSGQSGLGKKMVALEFAKSLACSVEGLEGKEHQTCRVCSMIDKGNHPDVLMIEPDGKEIKIDQIRKIQHDASLSAGLMDIKVFIIKQAEAINLQAQNCFLKTLEEPKGRVIFILLAANPDQLIPTIRSRCFQLKFYPLSRGEMSGMLGGTAENAEQQQLLDMAQGCPGRLIKLQQPEYFQSVQQTFKTCERIVSGDLIIRFKIAKKLFSAPEASKTLNDFLNQLAEFLKMRLEELIKNDGAVASGGYGRNSTVGQIKTALDKTEELRMLAGRTNINPRIAFENLLLSF